MNSLKHMFKSKVAVPMLALGSLFAVKDADAQTLAYANTSVVRTTSPASDRAKEFIVNADGVTMDDEDPAVAKLTVVDANNLTYVEIGRDARNVSSSGKVLAITMNIGDQAMYTPEQIIDALDNRVFTGKNEIALKIYQVNDKNSELIFFSVFSNGKEMMESSIVTKNERSGHYAYGQLKDNPQFFIQNKNNAVAYSNSL